MKIKEVTAVKTEGEARQIAIDWQIWASKKSLSYLELCLWNNF